MKAFRPSAFLLAAALTACGSAPRPVAGVPDELLDPAVTPDNVQQTICRLGYVASVSPPDAQLANAKRRMMLRAGLDLDVSGTYVLDRAVPISLGGHPSREANLRLQDLSGERNVRRKQALERRLHQLVCASKLGLREAQAAMVPDWLPAYARYIEGEAARP
jgi:hypothetical protein